MTSTTETGLVLLLIAIVIIFWRRHRHAARTIAQPDRARLMRIKNTSFIFSVLIWLGIALGSYGFLAFIFSWPAPFSGGWRIVAAPGHVYTSVAEIPTPIFWLCVVKEGLMFFGAGVLLRLFWLYQRGIFFTAKNVNCIRFLGYYLIVNWVVDHQIQGALRDMDLSLTPVFIGLLIIFVAWIMDEGRKIQEEQELTV